MFKKTESRERWMIGFTTHLSILLLDHAVKQYVVLKNLKVSSFHAYHGRIQYYK